MDNKNKCEQAANEFTDFIRAAAEEIDDDKLLAQCAQMFTTFGFFMSTLKEESQPDFRKLYKFALAIQESGFSEKDKHTIVFRALAIIEKHFPDFYALRNSDILLLFFDVVKPLLISASILLLLQETSKEKLPYPGYLKIQKTEIERLISFGGEYHEKEVLSKLEMLEN